VGVIKKNWDWGLIKMSFTVAWNCQANKRQKVIGRVIGLREIMEWKVLLFFKKFLIIVNQ